MVLGAGIQCPLLFPPTLGSWVTPRQVLRGVLEQGNHLGRLANSTQMEVVPGAQLSLLAGQGQSCAKGVAVVAVVAKRSAQGQEALATCNDYF